MKLPGASRITAGRGLASGLAFHAVAFLLCLALYTQNIFGFKSTTESVSAEILNLAFSRFYPAAHRDDIVVVVITDEDIDFFGDRFPVTYFLHELALSRIASFQPKAVFIDFVFARAHEKSERSDADRFAQILKEYPIPLFLAAGHRTTERPNGLEPKFALRPLVSVPKFVNLSMRSAYCFHFFEPLSGSSGASEPECTDTPGADTKPAAALALYDFLCGGDAPDARCPRSGQLRPFRDDYFRLIWGSAHSNLFEFLPDRHPCKVTPWYELLQPVGEAVATDCPYHPQISVFELLAGANNPETGKRMADAMRGKIILYGGFIGPSPDLVRPPTVRGIPGVHMHAMALDNLLTFGNGYKADTARIAGISVSAGTVNLIFFVFAYFLAIARDARSARTQECDLCGTLLTASMIAFYAVFCALAFAMLNLAPVNWVGAALTTAVIPTLLRKTVMNAGICTTTIVSSLRRPKKTTRRKRKSGRRK